MTVTAFFDARGGTIGKGHLLTVEAGRPNSRYAGTEVHALVKVVNLGVGF